MDEGDVYQDVQPVAIKKPKISKSRVWNDFQKVYVGSKVRAAVCIHCNSQLTAGYTGTSHLLRHLRKCQRGDNVNEKALTASSAQPSPIRVSYVKDWEFDQEESRRKLVRMIALHDFPFDVVESEGFNDFSKSLNPVFKMVPQGTVKADCMAIFEKEKQKMRQKFASSSQRNALSVSLWTSKQSLEYISVAAHFVDDEWKLQKQLLIFCMVESPRTASAMANVILKGVRDWNLHNRISSITLEEFSTSDLIVDRLKETLLVKGTLLLNRNLFHLRCAGQVLDFLVQSCLKEFQSVISRVRESVKYLKTSSLRKHRFLEVVREVGLSYTTSLCLDAVTHWNSTYHMLERALLLKKAFISLAVIDSSYDFAPSSDDWETVEVVCRLLRTFYTVGKVISGFNSHTSNLYFHEIWRVRTVLQQEATNKNLFVSTVAVEMHKRFNKYWRSSYLSLAIPILFDPQFKMKYVEYRFQQAFGDEAHKYISEVYNALLALFDEYQSRSSSEGVSQNIQNGVASEDVANSGDFDALSDWDQHISQQSSITQQNNMTAEIVGTSKANTDALLDWDSHISEQPSYHVMTELDRYCEDGLLSRMHGFDVLTWWKTNKSKYPILAQIARDVLPMPASAIASDSVFSTAGRVLDDFRSFLGSDIIEALICTQDWIRAERGIGGRQVGLDDDLSILEI